MSDNRPMCNWCVYATFERKDYPCTSCIRNPDVSDKYRSNRHDASIVRYKAVPMLPPTLEPTKIVGIDMNENGLITKYSNGTCVLLKPGLGAGFYSDFDAAVRVRDGRV